MIFFILSLIPAFAQEVGDTVVSESDVIAAVDSLLEVHDDTVYIDRKQSPDWWINRLKARNLNMQDTTVIYPRFIKFCVDVYNWADKAFNSYDPEYVVGTGKRWKARVVSDNWVDSYSMSFPKQKQSLRMMNDIYANIGAYLQYMAVSVGYSFNINNIGSDQPANRKKFEFGFNCARFNAELYYTENTGGTYLRKISGYNNNRLFKTYFPGLNLYTFGISAYYFLNNKRYSHGAAYNFSKFQLKSQGSWIFGLQYGDQDITLDFSLLDKEIRDQLTLDPLFLKFHYSNIAAIIGYGYNWVWNKHLLFNISVMPSIGINRCSADSAEGDGTLLSLNPKGSMSLTYNTGNFFIGLIGKADSHWYKSDKYSLLDAIFNASANIGIRF